MQVHRDINNLPPFKDTVLTIGTFDGVHSGHVEIIKQVKKEAEKINGSSLIITFDPHPRMVLSPDQNTSLQLLNTLQEKIELIESHGIDHLVIVPFTKSFAEQHPQEYIKDFLVEKFHPQIIITGYDHHFGKDRKGNYKMLEEYGVEGNYKVEEIPAHVLDNVSISSTKIRQALKDGNISSANLSLGYEYFFTGIVVDGNKLGRTLGYPTANIYVADEHKLIPPYGVYAVTVKIPNEEENFETAPLYKGMMNIGIRPTIGDNKIMTEVNIFDFDENIYGKEMRVYVRNFMRGEIKFENLDELVIQLAKDEVSARKQLAS
jgi:riboflavin kinase/FMN adenylyltransferase